nr:MAG TPA: hypothetical protein [Caudoviricetes sp.]
MHSQTLILQRFYTHFFIFEHTTFTKNVYKSCTDSSFMAIKKRANALLIILFVL